jgi:hypothetical protein
MVRFKLSSVKKAISKPLSLIICLLCLALPYTAREIFVFLLHLIFNKLSVKIKLVLNIIFNIYIIVLMFPIYFCGFFLTVLFKKMFSPRCKVTCEEDNLMDKENIWRMY